MQHYLTLKARLFEENKMARKFNKKEQLGYAKWSFVISPLPELRMLQRAEHAVLMGELEN
jgi:hypothetical protein